MSMRQAAQDALFAQEASNLSGIVHSLSRHLTETIWPAVRADGGGTQQVNHHPICRLFAEQIAYLTGGTIIGNAESYSAAYRWCEEQAAQPEPADETPAEISEPAVA